MPGHPPSHASQTICLSRKSMQLFCKHRIQWTAISIADLHTAVYTRDIQIQLLRA